MQFIDEAKLHVCAGKGGGGALSFRREKHVAKGGPDGGDGGDGGNVLLLADPALNTLVDFRYQPRHQAGNGQPGGGRNKTGADGRDRLIRVPLGTTVTDLRVAEVLGDLGRPGQRLLVARGGRRGLGNARFKSSTNQAPRKTTLGQPGEERELALQLRLLADVGLLGLPNAGKSTLLAKVSAARPKIAGYPFTTLTPNLGVVRVAAEASFVMADVPGLIAGAAQGAGLGAQFLRHLSRTSLLLHLVDAHPADAADPIVNAAAIEAEVRAYSAALAERPVWLVLTKTDLLHGERVNRLLQRLVDAFPGRRILATSALAGAGLDALTRQVMAALLQTRERLAGDAAARRQEQALAQRILADVSANALAQGRWRRRRFDRAAQEVPMPVVAPPADAANPAAPTAAQSARRQGGPP